MSNLQPLSPQGYNIQDRPYNDNPFWSNGDEPVDPSVYERLDTLDEEVATLQSGKVDNSQLNNYYTKSQVDQKIADIPGTDLSNYYTKTEVDTLQTTTKSQVLDQVQTNYYNKTQMDNSLSTKANISAFNNYYDKTEIDSTVSDLEGANLILSGRITSAQNTADTAAGQAGSALSLAQTLQGAVTNLDTDMEAVQGDLENKVDTATLTADYYNKTQVDDLIAQGGSFNPNLYYTKSATDQLLAGKADNTDIYSKSELNNMLAAKADAASVYTKTQTDTLLNSKANTADVYTKTQTDTLLGDKADTADVYTKTETDTLLNAKADASTTYSKTQVDNLVGSKADASNVYTKTETDILLSSKADASTTYTKSEVDTLIAGKADTTDLQTTDARVTSLSNQLSDNKYVRHGSFWTYSYTGESGETYKQFIERAFSDLLSEVQTLRDSRRLLIETITIAGNRYLNATPLFYSNQATNINGQSQNIWCNGTSGILRFLYYSNSNASVFGGVEFNGATFSQYNFLSNSANGVNLTITYSIWEKISAV